MFSAQLLVGLAARGHRIEAITPITAAGLENGDRFAERNPELTVTRFELPYLATGPDMPPTPEYREHERAMIGALLEQAVGRRRPDVLIAGREAIVPQLEDLECVRGTPRMLVIHGTTMFGIARGTYPRELAEPLLASMRGYDRIVTSGHHARRSMADLGVPGVQVIPNPVDLDRFRPRDPDPDLRRELTIAPDDTVVLHASKLTEQKRPLDIIAAAERALGEDPRLLFVIAGEGRCRVEVECECEARGLGERFRFPGWVDHSRMPALLSVADMVVMPSAYECQALIYLEAMACARPLIASDIPAAREVVDPGVNGLLHPEGDIEALARAILACANHRTLTSRLVAGGREQAQRHALPLIVDRYEAVLTELRDRAPQ
jgi:glycosyltransferase involved in cell wall biosynthesis